MIRCLSFSPWGRAAGRDRGGVLRSVCVVCECMCVHVCVSAWVCVAIFFSTFGEDNYLEGTAIIMFNSSGLLLMKVQNAELQHCENYIIVIILHYHSDVYTV